MELTNEELSILLEAIRSIQVHGRPLDVIKYYQEKLAPLERKLTEEAERRRMQAADAPVSRKHQRK